MEIPYGQPQTATTHLQLKTTELLIPKLLLALTSTVILGSELRGTHYHILLSDGSGSLQTTTVLDGSHYIALAWSA
jgi:hypothetical protein